MPRLPCPIVPEPWEDVSVEVRPPRHRGAKCRVRFVASPPFLPLVACGLRKRARCVGLKGSLASPPFLPLVACGLRKRASASAKVLANATCRAGLPAHCVHNGATAPRRHHGAAREGAPRLDDVLGVLLLPYGHARPQRRPRSRGLEPRYITRSRASHDIVGLFRARTMGASHQRAGAAATSITSPPRLGFDNQPRSCLL